MNRMPATSDPFPSLAGSLLVASPSLSDGLFARSVCLLVEHEAQGAAGVVLNRPIVAEVGPLWQELTAGAVHVAEPPKHLHFGGPVSGPVVAVHDLESLADAGTGAGVYLAAQFETLKKLTFVAPSHYRLLVGHAAWKAGQLEQEILDGLWHPIPASSDLVFMPDDSMWQLAYHQVSASIFRSITGIEPLPVAALEFN